ncbi:uncharacterized protein LOC114147042 isoform X1 [Xiphophorus couchianus]|uniref:uncharacterized protein LOC114147042 isoform X1 n=1 Tax=Xiphophorus couchianus TaxID=32473 RepID=UPI001016EE04|nr:uncharacterized protein LOC114147042 isoform X1 [Xiphophorus couchianus]
MQSFLSCEERTMDQTSTVQLLFTFTRSVGLMGEMKPINLLPLLLFFSGQIQGNTEMIQKLHPTGKESNISFPVEKLPRDSTVLWLDHLNRTIATYYSYGETKLEQRFDGKVKIAGPTTLTFLNPQTSDSGLYCAKVIGDKDNTVMCFNVTFADQNTVSTVAVLAVSPAVLVLVIIAAVGLWCYLKKKCQDQTEDVVLSANSGTNSPIVQILLPPTQDNGDPHNIEENAADSPV